MSTFSPRDVQARVRAGESIEDIVGDTGWPADKVERYAEPLLQERAYIAEQAQAVEVRRTGGSVSLRSSALHALGTADQQLSWDAYRRDDGRWVVVARYGTGDKARQAQWTYDPAGRNLHPLDDQARALMGVAHEAVTPAAVEVITDALDLVREDTDARDADRMRPHLVAVPDEPEPDVLDVQVTEILQVQVTETVVVEDAPEQPREDTQARPAQKSKSRKGGRRASVPSWDDILFGSGKADD